MERRTFILGMGSVLMGACASKPGLKPGSNPYAVGTPTAALGTGAVTPPPPPAPRQGTVPRLVHTEQGDRVRCAPGGVHYTTKRGDTLQGIATRYEIPAASICRANPGRISATRVTPGRMIWLPGARPIACEPVVADRGAVPSPCEAPVRSRPEPRRGGYRIVRRADWGAESLKPNHDPMNGVRRITLHHTDEVPGIRARGDREIVAAIQRYHRNELGWADIGYHYLIGRDGLVYEGRTATAQGAHSGGANNIQNLGIAMVGNFSHRMPTHGQMRALEGFLGDQQRMHRVGTRQVYGHRDLGPTECPGTTLYGWLQQYKTHA